MFEIIGLTGSCSTGSCSPNIVYNFSTYDLSEAERKALAYGLDHYIPDKIDKRKLEVEFENLYQNILWHADDIEEERCK